MLTDVANSTGKFGFSSGSPVVTSNGTDPASALVWVIYAAGPGTKGMLEAFARSRRPAAPARRLHDEPGLVGADRHREQVLHPGHRQRPRLRGHQGRHVLGFGSPDACAGHRRAHQLRPEPGRHPGHATVPTATSAVTLSNVTPTSTARPTRSASAGHRERLLNTPVTGPIALDAGDALTVPVTFTPRPPAG